MKPDLIAEALNDPLEAFDALRRRGNGSGITYDEATGSHYVLTADLVRSLSRDPRLKARGVPVGVMALSDEERQVVLPVEEFFGRWMAFSDPPRQARIRRALAPCLARPRLATALVELPAFARSLVGPVVGGGDLIADVAAPLSRWTTAAVLDASADEVASLSDASAALIRYLSIPGFDTGAATAALSAIDKLRSVVIDGLLPRRGSVAVALSDLLGGDAGIEEIDVLAAYAQLLTGAMEPLTGAMAGAMLTAARSRTGSKLIRPIDSRAAQALLDVAISTYPPFHFAPRIAVTDIEIQGHVISQGDRVVLNLLTASAELAAGAARDLADRASACPIDRKVSAGEPTAHDPSVTNSHLAFGMGAHYCLGAVATRLHVELALPELARLIPLIDLGGVVPTRVFGASAWARMPLRPSGSSVRLRSSARPNMTRGADSA